MMPMGGYSPTTSNESVDSPNPSMFIFLFFLGCYLDVNIIYSDVSTKSKKS